MKSTWAYRNGQRELKRVMDDAKEIGTSWKPVKRIQGVLALSKAGVIKTFSNRKQANAALINTGCDSAYVTASWPFLVCKPV